MIRLPISNVVGCRQPVSLSCPKSCTLKWSGISHAHFCSRCWFFVVSKVPISFFRVLAIQQSCAQNKEGLKWTFHSPWDEDVILVKPAGGVEGTGGSLRNVTDDEATASNPNRGSDTSQSPDTHPLATFPQPSDPSLSNSAIGIISGYAANPPDLARSFSGQSTVEHTMSAGGTSSSHFGGNVHQNESRPASPGSRNLLSSGIYSKRFNPHSSRRQAAKINYRKVRQCRKTSEI